jgi:hypothetical protein
MTFWIIVILIVSPCNITNLTTTTLEHHNTGYSMPTCSVSTEVKVVYSNVEAEQYAGEAHDIFQVQDGKVTRVEVEAVYRKERREIEERVLDHYKFKK